MNDNECIVSTTAVISFSILALFSTILGNCAYENHVARKVGEACAEAGMVFFANDSAWECKPASQVELEQKLEEAKKALSKGR